ncbi:arsenic resistance N-acetyltransferase ArsN2 [Pseudoxanthomonas sp. LjRoot125]|uniref:arsenic resistance N-acetyltransferase ArsN2 n=1 Tax=Pseudoxanthomonas sp. LjRoot125 TaxID=3342258 RepID=UPI003E121996
MSTIRPANGADLPRIAALLDAEALPTTDLTTSRIAFLIDEDHAGLVAAIGLEQHADTGLLRSLVVAPAHRGAGHARRLVEALEAQARACGIRDLVLLTQTAAPFFARAGYAVITRGNAPRAVQDSAEFRALCPASATCMHKVL